MKSLSALLLTLLLATTVPAHAQDDSACPVGQLQPIDSEAPADSMSATTSDGIPLAKRSAVTDPRPAASVTPTTDAESFVQERIEKDGLHVVHFWAPWCQNSKNELAHGWADLVASNPNVTFTFVTVWNDGETGTAVLNEHDFPERVATVVQPDLGPSDTESNRRHSFLSHPVTWIPSTWIFHNKGELAFALNYGEMEMSTIQSLLDVTSAEW